MPAKDPRTRHLVARRAALQRHHGPESPATLDARRDLIAATLEERIAEAVAAAPPLSSQQKARLSVLLRGGDAA